MKKIIIIFVVFTTMLFTSCCESKEIEINKKIEIIEPYGFANEDIMKNDSVDYQMSPGSVICAVIFCETLIVPIYVVGWNLYEPVKKKK